MTVMCFRSASKAELAAARCRRWGWIGASHPSPSARDTQLSVSLSGPAFAWRCPSASSVILGLACALAAPSPNDPNALGSYDLPKFAHTTTQNLRREGKHCRSGVEPGQRLHYARQLSPYSNQLNKEAGRHRMSSSQEQQVGGAWSVSLDFRCRQLEHDRCSMA
ncbi:hypothetical protein HaLaN_10187 [Haematococcus lacustris]|uniref:Uncharacterized protein n=1 Tax=Haematococcus lacustris TaxID=44745 RepID=A0A699YX61_HAELA|nr:hypothetical protein HaLaN_10187 [Haematococcus lacustris]